MASGTQPAPFVERNVFGPSVDLTVYDSTNNKYTLPCSGLIAVRNSGSSANGAARIFSSDSSNTNFILLGVGTGCYLTYMPKGVQVYIAGTVTTAYFVPLN